MHMSVHCCSRQLHIVVPSIYRELAVYPVGFSFSPCFLAIVAIDTHCEPPVAHESFASSSTQCVGPTDTVTKGLTLHPCLSESSCIAPAE